MPEYITQGSRFSLLDNLGVDEWTEKHQYTRTFMVSAWVFFFKG